METQQIIRKAVEGGYMPTPAILYCGANEGNETENGPATNQGWSVWNMLNESSFCQPHSETVLDPLFWQSLGKACGWNIYHSIACYTYTGGTCGDCYREKRWLHEAKEFHEINLTEGWDKAIEYLLQVTNSKE